MPVKNRYLFVSYARDDLERVRPLVDAVREELALRSLPVSVWMDIANLKPGEQWNAAISEALKAAVGFLFFLSPRSISSDWVRREVEIAATASDRLIIPVILYEPLDVPPTLASRQWLRFVGRPSPEDTAKAAAEIAEATERYLRATPRPRSAVSKAEAPIIAADHSAGRSARRTTPSSRRISRSRRRTGSWTRPGTVMKVRDSGFRARRNRLPSTYSARRLAAT
jgi:TIR domain